MAITKEVAHMALDNFQTRLNQAAPGADPGAVIDFQHRINALRARTNQLPEQEPTHA